MPSIYFIKVAVHYILNIHLNIAAFQTVVRTIRPFADTVLLSLSLTAAYIPEFSVFTTIVDSCCHVR